MIFATVIFHRGSPEINDSVITAPSPQTLSSFFFLDYTWSTSKFEKARDLSLERYNVM